MGLFSFFRSKPEDDPILGGRDQPPTGLRAETVTQTVTAHDVDEHISPGDLVDQLQAAGGDTEELTRRLRAMFPDAQISVSESTVGGAGAADQISQLERLAALRRSGALTDAEFAAAKAKLLGSS